MVLKKLISKEKSMENKTTTEQEDNKAPFNFAIASLMRVHEILRDIKNISLNKEKLPNGIMQKKKLKLTRDLCVQCSPLIKNKEVRNELWDELKETKMVLKKVTQTMTPYIMPIFKQETEDQLDEIIMKIEDELQTSGYFMPDKSEGALF